MLPEISARRSLLEPSFRYLSPGREGEKCRPLDHMGQIPFIHSDRFLILNNFYIYTILSHLFLPCGTVCGKNKCLHMTIAHALSQKTQIIIQSFLSFCMLVCIETSFTRNHCLYLVLKKGVKRKQKRSRN